jgi:hypothetical protein
LQQRTYAALEPAMSVLTSTRPLPSAATRTGQALTVFLTLFFLFDSLPKLLQLPAVVEATTQMGFAPSAVPIIGAVLLVCLVLYLVPRTAILGGYLGGAVCAQLRIEAPLFSTMLFPVYFGVVVWVALYLRSPQLRKLVAASLS